MPPKLDQLLDIKYPIIMAPMFLVTNVEMILAADKAGISGCIPALNFHKVDQLAKALTTIKENTKHSFGVNLIVNKSNIYYKKQLDIICDLKINYVITSLGSPKEVIKKCHAKGIKVFCDVVNLEYAKKVSDLGADAIIAVNSRAGGHPGKLSADALIPQLKKRIDIPIISAGGVASAKGLQEILELGADGVSIGTPFIATNESVVSSQYKDAIVQYGANDIVLTNRISGTPCSVINTPYVQKMSLKQNFLELFLNKNRRVKKILKAIIYIRGAKMLKKAAFEATYQKVWCAGPSIEFVKKIQPISKFVESLYSTDNSL